MTSPLTIRTILAAALLIAWPATAALAQAPPPGPDARSAACAGPRAGPTASCG